MLRARVADSRLSIEVNDRDLGGFVTVWDGRNSGRRYGGHGEEIHLWNFVTVKQSTEYSGKSLPET